VVPALGVLKGKTDRHTDRHTCGRKELNREGRRKVEESGTTSQRPRSLPDTEQSGILLPREIRAVAASFAEAGATGRDRSEGPRQPSPTMGTPGLWLLLQLKEPGARVEARLPEGPACLSEPLPRFCKTYVTKNVPPLKG